MYYSILSSCVNGVSYVSSFSTCRISPSSSGSSINDPLLLRSLTGNPWRSEEHTSELQSRFDLVCRLLLEKKKLIRKNIKMILKLYKLITHSVGNNNME